MDEGKSRESEPGEDKSRIIGGDKPRRYDAYGLMGQRRGGVYPRPQTHVSVRMGGRGRVYPCP